MAAAMGKYESGLVGISVFFGSLVVATIVGIVAGSGVAGVLSEDGVGAGLEVSLGVGEIGGVWDGDTSIDGDGVALFTRSGFVELLFTRSGDGV